MSHKSSNVDQLLLNCSSLRTCPDKNCIEENGKDSKEGSELVALSVRCLITKHTWSLFFQNDELRLTYHTHISFSLSSACGTANWPVMFLKCIFVPQVCRVFPPCLKMSHLPFLSLLLYFCRTVTVLLVQHNWTGWEKECDSTHTHAAYAMHRETLIKKRIKMLSDIQKPPRLDLSLLRGL